VIKLKSDVIISVTLTVNALTMFSRRNLKIFYYTTRYINMLFTL